MLCSKRYATAWAWAVAYTFMNRLDVYVELFLQGVCFAAVFEGTSLWGCGLMLHQTSKKRRAAARSADEVFFKSASSDGGGAAVFVTEMFVTEEALQGRQQGLA